MNTQEVADKFIQFWREGRNDEAVKAFYSDKTIHQTPGFLYSRKVEQANGIEISELLVIGEYFCLRLKINVALKDFGTSILNESWVFKAKEGKIVYERFFNYNTKVVLV